MTAAPEALAGVRVLELGEGIAIPFAARLLADLGADVIKVEPPTGDPMRDSEPLLTATSGERSALFEYLNWNKRSIVTDPADRDSLPVLLAGTDILFVGDGLGCLEAWGLDVEQLRSQYPSLAVVAVSSFGATGTLSAWRGSDLIAQAAGGLMQISGVAGREPLKRGLRQSAYTSGLTAAYAALIAYYGATHCGHGAYVDVAAAEAVAAELILNGPTYSFMGAVQCRRPASKDPFSGEPLPTKDGYACVQTNTWVTLPMFADLLGEPRIAEERFDTRVKRNLRAAELTDVLSDALGRTTGRDLMVRGSERGMLVGFAQTAEQLLECPHLQARGVFRAIDGAVGALGPWRLPAKLAELSETPTRVRTGSPALGANTGESWLAPRPAPKPHPVSGPCDGPLKGLKVVDLSSVVAVPLIAGMLRDMGATVIKVEAPNRLDQGRGPMFGPLLDNEPGREPWNRSGAFHSMNRGKESICLDLKQEKGRDVLRRLVADADILLENFTPRVMRGWRLAWEDLKAINPRLIMMSNTGYGSTGPWSTFKAQGTTLELTMGVGTYSGYPGDKPTKVGQSYPDFVAAWSGLVSLMAALVHRDRTGSGQWIDCGMYQLGVSMIPEAFVAVQGGQTDPGRRGNADIGALLSGAYQTAGDDRWIAVSVADRAAWRGLASLVAGVPADPGPEDPVAASEALARWCAERPSMPAALELQRAGVAASPVNDARDMLLDWHFYQRGLFEDVDLGPGIGVRPVLSRGFRWHGTCRVGIRGPGPRFAQHNDAVLDRYGYSPDERRALRVDRVVFDEPVDPPELPPTDLAGGIRNGLYSAVDTDYLERLTRGREAMRQRLAAGTRSAAPETAAG